jgi:hypothetical protein
MGAAEEVFRTMVEDVKREKIQMLERDKELCWFEERIASDPRNRV